MVGSGIGSGSATLPGTKIVRSAQSGSTGRLADPGGLFTVSRNYYLHCCTSVCVVNSSKAPFRIRVFFPDDFFPESGLGQNPDLDGFGFLKTLKLQVHWYVQVNLKKIYSHFCIVVFSSVLFWSGSLKT